MLEQLEWNMSTMHIYVNKATYNDWGIGVWVQLNQTQYIIKGMAHGTGLHLVYNKLKGPYS